MKKLLLSIIAIVAGFNCASADETTYILSNVNDTAYAITADADAATAFITANSSSISSSATGDSWWFLANAGLVLYSDDNLTIETATSSYIVPGGSHLSEIQGSVSNATGYMNLGSSLNQHFTTEDVIEDPTSIAGSWQGMYKVTTKCAGVLGFCAYASNSRNIGIWEMPASDDATGCWKDTLTIDGTEATSGIVSCEATANGEYLLVAGSTNTNLGYITFVPATVDENEGEEEVETEIDPGINLLTQVNDTTFAIIATPDEAAEYAAAVGDDAGYVGSGDTWYFEAKADIVLYKSDTLKIKTAADYCYIANSGNHISNVQNDNPSYTGYLNLASTLNGTFSEEDIEDGDDPTNHSSTWQGMYKVKVNYDGVLGLYVYVGNNNRNIGIWENPTSDAAGSWKTIVNFDGDTATSGYVSCDVTAGNEYTLVAGGTNTNVGEINFIPTGYTTGIKGITSIATATDNKIYSIDGRFLGTNKDNLSKGLYIMNGKKMLVK